MLFIWCMRKKINANFFHYIYFLEYLNYQDLLYVTILFAITCNYVLVVTIFDFFLQLIINVHTLHGEM